MTKRPLSEFRWWTRLELFPEDNGDAHLYVMGIIGYCLYDVILSTDLESPMMRAELRGLKRDWDIEPYRIRQAMNVFVASGQDKKVVMEPTEKPLVELPRGT